MSNEKKDEPLASSLVEDLDQSDQITSLVTRTAKFMELFDKMEFEGIDLSGPEAVSVARSATNELGIKQKVSDLSDLKLEDLSEYEFHRILARARSAIKRVIELRTRFSPIMKTTTKSDGTEEKIKVGTFGPYWKNRKTRRQESKKSGLRASSRSSLASGIVRTIKSGKVVSIVPGM